MSSILIIDDEDKYLELCRRYLPEHDFSGPARNFREAAEALSRRRSEIDLVLLDVHFDIPEEDLLPVDKAQLLAGSNHDRVIERLRRSQGLRILDRLRQGWADLPGSIMAALGGLPTGP